MIAGDPYPDLLADLDGQRVGRTRPRALLEALHEAQNARTVAWTIAAYPNERWAEQVFGEPDVERLWQAISDSVGLEEADPVAAWREHVATLRDRCSAAEQACVRPSALPRPRHRPHGGAPARRAVERRRRHDPSGRRARPEHADRGGLRLSRLAAHGGHGALDASARPRRHCRPRPRDVIRRG